MEPLYVSEPKLSLLTAIQVTFDDKKFLNKSKHPKEILTENNEVYNKMNKMDFRPFLEKNINYLD